MQDVRVTALDGLRGWAAVTVLFYHAILGFDYDRLVGILLAPVQAAATPYDLWTKFWLTTLNGECAVILFFLLSGCVLIRSIDRDLARDNVLTASIAYGVRRIFRIYPALIACILGMSIALTAFSFLIYWPHGAVANLRDMLENMVLYRNMVNGATWTLRVEMLAVPFLILAGLLHRLLPRIGLFLFLALTGWIFASPWWRQLSPELSANLIYFALGCLVPQRMGARAAWLAGRAGWLPVLLLFIYPRRFFPYAAELPILLQAGFGFALLCLIYHRPPGRLARFLANPVSLFLGRISYGFYLWNVLFLNMMGSLRARHPPGWTAHPVEAGLVYALLVTAMTLPIAAVTERWVERPGIRLGRAVSDRLIASKRAAAPARA